MPRKHATENTPAAFWNADDYRPQPRQAPDLQALVADLRAFLSDAGDQQETEPRTIWLPSLRRGAYILTEPLDLSGLGQVRIQGDRGTKILFREEGRIDCSGTIMTIDELQLEGDGSDWGLILARQGNTSINGCRLTGIEWVGRFNKAGLYLGAVERLRAWGCTFYTRNDAGISPPPVAVLADTRDRSDLGLTFDSTGSAIRFVDCDFYTHGACLNVLVAGQSTGWRFLGCGFYCDHADAWLALESYPTSAYAGGHKANIPKDIEIEGCYIEPSGGRQPGVGMVFIADDLDRMPDPPRGLGAEQLRQTAQRPYLIREAR